MCADVYVAAVHTARCERGVMAISDICSWLSMHIVVPLQGAEGAIDGRGQGLLSGVTVIIRTGSLCFRYWRQ